MPVFSIYLYIGIYCLLIPGPNEGRKKGNDLKRLPLHNPDMHTGHVQGTKVCQRSTGLCCARYDIHLEQWWVTEARALAVPKKRKKKKDNFI